MMIHFEPEALMEAHFFLSIRQAGETVEKFFSHRESKNLPLEIPMCEYISILTELEGRMEASIEVDEAEIAMLYNPLDDAKTDDFPTSYFLANLIIDGIDSLCLGEKSFAQIRATKDEIPGRIALRILGEWSGELYTRDEITNIILDSKLASDSKLLLINLVTNPDNFIDMVERVLKPIAAEFVRCRKLYEPLLVHYREIYSKINTLEDEAKLLTEIANQEFEYVKSYDIYPLVTYFNMFIFSFTDPKSEHIMICIGTISDITRAYYRGVDTAAKLSGIMATLGNRNRMEILMSLTGGRRYGRELAASFGITSAGISQHMEALLAVGLVKFDTSGKRVYYSLNHDTLRQFVDLFVSHFLPEA